MPEPPRARSDSQTARSRFENKYIVSPAVVPAMRQFLLAVASPDPFSKAGAQPQYSICSLYLDTADLRFYRQTMEGAKTRFKLRVRTYSDDPGTPAFLEVKSRIDRIVRKRRVCLPRAQAVAVLNRQVRWWDVCRHRDSAEDLDYFTGQMALTSCRPLVRIRYLREAYIGVPPEPVRVTFDTNLQFQPTFGSELGPDSDEWIPMAVGGVILEVKFSGTAPAWVEHLVGCFSLQRVSCCKFAHAVTRMLRIDGWGRLTARGFSLPRNAA